MIPTVIPRCPAQGRTSIKSGTCPCRLSTKANKGNNLSPPHRRDFKDCKQILEDSLTPPLHIKARSRLQPGKPSEDLPYGQSGIRRLPGCLRYAPASSQSSSIHNSLRSIKQTAVWRLSSFSPGKFCELRDFAYGQNLCVLYAKFPPPKAKRLQLVYAPQSPQGKNDRLRYRSAEWTVSTPWPARLT